MKVKIPNSIIKCYEKGLIIGIVQFGSSLYSKKANDIDLAIVIKKDCYVKFVKHIIKKEFKNFDISLIREEEITNWNKFRFGNHGLYLIPVLKSGIVLFGVNSFLTAPDFDQKSIKESIFPRLADYIYNLRKSIFKEGFLINVKKRWPKFLRLALLYIDKNLKFPDVMKLRNSEIDVLLRKNNLEINSKDLVNAYEILWQKINLKN
ncbi:MAG: hypothetical protein AAB394_02610 [Patescibacteria group bacterium]